MKKLFFLFLIIGLASCAPQNEPTGICGAGNNLCFEIDGNYQSFDARWSSISTGYGMIASKVIGTDSVNIDVRVHSVNRTVESINFWLWSLPTPGGIIYKVDSLDYYGFVGTINITNVSENKVSGNFNAELHGGVNSDTLQLTNGHLDAIPHH